jgi:hypothetical protein
MCVGSVLRHRPRSFEEFWLAPIHSPPLWSPSPVPPLGRDPLVQSWHSQEHRTIGHGAELSDPEAEGSVYFWTALPPYRRYQHDNHHIIAGSWTFWCTHSHCWSLAVDARILIACGARFLLKGGSRGTPCRTHSTTLGDCPKEWRYTCPTRQLWDHIVAMLRIRSSGAQSSEAVQTWIQLPEASG